MSACCGLNCTKCVAFLATRADDDAKRAEVAKDWSEQSGTEIKPEQINCTGCRSDGIRFFEVDSCELRKCCMEKGFECCSDCDEYPCNKLRKLFEKVPQLQAILDGFMK